MHGNGVYSGLEFKVQKVAIPMRHEGESTEDENDEVETIIDDVSILELEAATYNK